MLHEISAAKSKTMDLTFVVPSAFCEEKDYETQLTSPALLFRSLFDLETADFSFFLRKRGEFEEKGEGEPWGPLSRAETHSASDLGRGDACSEPESAAPHGGGAKGGKGGPFKEGKKVKKIKKEACEKKKGKAPIRRRRTD